jgi:hypothetical protein
MQDKLIPRSTAGIGQDAEGAEAFPFPFMI